MKVVLITGASSGFGFDLTKALLQKGYIVYAASRNVSAMEPLKALGAKILMMDVTQDESVTAGVAQLIQEQGKIDAVFNNAGYGYYGLVEEPDMAQVLQMYETNVFGLARVNNAVLPYMRKAKQGRLILTGSLVGNISLPGIGWYASTKHAVRALSESLRMELLPFGIQVVLIEPGSVKTGFRDQAMGNIQSVTLKQDYTPFVEHFSVFMEEGYQHSPGPEETVKAMIDALESTNPPWVYKTTKTARMYPRLKALLGSKRFYQTATNQIMGKQKR
jgi:NADP-dependent 3-hydroxy acid dehydrogenase YdfG